MNLFLDFIVHINEKFVERHHIHRMFNNAPTLNVIIQVLWL